MLRLASLPAGGDMTLTYYRNDPFATPYQAPESIGFVTSVVARAAFTAGGRSYTFERWSDGPTARVRNVTVPGAPMTLVARYRDVTPAPKPKPKPRRPTAAVRPSDSTAAGGCTRADRACGAWWPTRAG